MNETLSRMPDVLYEMLIPDNVILGSDLTIRIDSNPWTNDTSAECTAPSTVTGFLIFYS